MRRKPAMTLVAVLGVLALTGCGSSDGDSTSTSGSTGASTSGPATTASKTPPKVAVLHYALNDYSQVEIDGIKSVVDPAGGSVDVFNANLDPQKQQQQCQDAITSKRFNVIVLAPSSPPLGVPCATAAKAAGIPVIGLEIPTGRDANTNELQTPGVVGNATYTSEDVATGQQDLLKKACEGLDPCKTIVEITVAGDPTTEAYVTKAKELPNVDVVSVVAGQYDPATIAKKIPDVLAAHPDTNVILFAADQQLEASVPAVKSAGLFGKIKLIGNGGGRPSKTEIADGTMFATAANYPLTMGAAAGKMAVQAAAGETVNPSVVDGLRLKEPFLITKENVDQFQPEWGRAR